MGRRAILPAHWKAARGTRRGDRRHLQAGAAFGAGAGRAAPGLEPADDPAAAGRIDPDERARQAAGARDDAAARVPRSRVRPLLPAGPDGGIPAPAARRDRRPARAICAARRAGSRVALGRAYPRRQRRAEAVRGRQLGARAVERAARAARHLLARGRELGTDRGTDRDHTQRTYGNCLAPRMDARRVRCPRERWHARRRRVRAQRPHDPAVLRSAVARPAGAAAGGPARRDAQRISVRAFRRALRARQPARRLARSGGDAD
ncbi:conserved protein of unknown function [Burkholderia multivorans]